MLRHVDLYDTYRDAIVLGIDIVQLIKFRIVRYKCEEPSLSSIHSTYKSYQALPLKQYLLEYLKRDSCSLGPELNHPKVK